MDIYTKVAGITQESVKDYKHHTLPNHVLSRQEMKTKQIENALRGFAAGCAEEDIELIAIQVHFQMEKKGSCFRKKGYMAACLII